MRVSENKLRKIIRQELMNESVKDFFKGAIYSDYEIAIQNIVKSGNHTNSGDLYLVPALEVANANVKIEEDELYSKKNGEVYVVILNEKTPLIGVSKITNYDFVKYKNRYREKLKAFIEENKIKPVEIKK